jgi:hypothetical protein
VKDRFGFSFDLIELFRLQRSWAAAAKVPENLTKAALPAMKNRPESVAPRLSKRLVSP